MAKQRRERAPETGGLAGILSQVGEAYKAAEPWGGGVWIPDEGVYEAVMCNFKEEERMSDDQQPYGWFRVGLLITSGDEKVRERETGVVFNTLPNKEGTFTGLRKLKGLGSLLNEGEAIEDLTSTIALIRRCCEEETPVQFEVDSWVYNDKTKKGVQITELLEPADDEF